MAMANIEKVKENLNLFSTFSTSMKTFENCHWFHRDVSGMVVICYENRDLVDPAHNGYV